MNQKPANVQSSVSSAASVAFRWPSQIRFHQADPAGWMFYGTAFAIAHDCFEDFISHLEIPRNEWFESKTLAVPIRATKANYLAPLRVGDHFEIRMHVSQIGESSLTVQFRFFKEQTMCLEVHTTHVFMDLATQSKCPIPHEIRERLVRYLFAL